MVYPVQMFQKLKQQLLQLIHLDFVLHVKYVLLMDRRYLIDLVLHELFFHEVFYHLHVM
jgi:hypothetical protein